MAANSLEGSLNSSSVCARAAIPIARVAHVALQLVKHGMQPVGNGIALVALGDGVCRFPVAGLGGIDGPDQLFLPACHVSHPLARSAHAGQWPQP